MSHEYFHCVTKMYDMDWNFPHSSELCGECEEDGEQLHYSIERDQINQQNSKLHCDFFIKSSCRDNYKSQTVWCWIVHFFRNHEAISNSVDLVVLFYTVGISTSWTTPFLDMFPNIDLYIQYIYAYFLYWCLAWICIHIYFFMWIMAFMGEHLKKVLLKKCC